MDNRPLIVLSKQHDNIHRKGFESFESRIRMVTSEDPIDFDARVVYMRLGHRLFDKECLEGVRIEKKFRARGAKIVNSMQNRIVGQRKDLYYPILLQGGISVPAFIPNPTWAEIQMYMEYGKWKLPIVYRTMDEAGGRGLNIVSNEVTFNTLRRQMSWRRCMAVQFINSRGRGNYWTKHRATVIGSKVYMWGASISQDWNTENLKSMPFRPQDIIDANRPGTELRQFDGGMVKIGKLLNMELYAVDIVQDCTIGKFYVIDVNPTCVVFDPPQFFPKEMQDHRRGYFKAVVDHLCGLAK